MAPVVGAFNFVVGRHWFLRCGGRVRLILDMGIRVLCGARRIWNGPDLHRQRSSVLTFFGIAAVIIFPTSQFSILLPIFLIL